MAVNLSPVFGAGAQLFNNDGVPLAGGLLYTYQAGTSTPLSTYTNNVGNVANSNPIVLDAAGRPPQEIWLTDSYAYKFVLKDANLVQIATWDNIVGINSNFQAFALQDEKQTATQGQTVFTLIGFEYQTGTNNLSVFVNGSKQISGTNYAETSASVVTFADGLNVGDIVEFTTAVPVSTNPIDASQVTYVPAGIDAVPTNVQEKLRESVSVKDFGATGDGSTDDYLTIQTAIEYGFANDVNIVFPSGTYAISQTIIIPQYFNYTYRGIEINGNFCNIKMLDDVPAFTSGYYNAGVLTTNFGTVLDSHFSAGIILKNFNIVSDVPNLQSGCIKIQDWHQASLIQGIASSVYDTMLYLVNSYYTQVDTVQSDGGKASFGGARFLFYDNNNLMKVTNCVSVNSGIAYQFQGAVDAFQFTNNSVEGCDVGIQTLGQVYDLAIENNYFEGVTLAMDFQSYVQVQITNNYFALGNDSAKRIIKYLPSPLNNILFDENNSVIGIATTFEQQLFYAKDTVYSAGVTIKQYQTGSGLLSSIVKDNTYLTPNADWQQKVLFRGTRANVVNNLVAGNYSGKFSSAYAEKNGFDATYSTNVAYLETKIIPSDTQRIYVNIRVLVSGVGYVFVKGEFIGTDFYEFTSTTISKTTTLYITVPASTVQINGAFAANVIEVNGEIRLI